MKNPRLKLHLSTLLISTLLAAGLVWLNVRADRLLEDDTYILNRGFPYPYHVWVPVSRMPRGSQ